MISCQFMESDATAEPPFNGVDTASVLKMSKV